MSSEAKVGLLVICFGILAIATGLYMTDVLSRWGSYQVTVQFADVQGLEPGAQVRLGGVSIGRVTEVALQPHKDFPGKSAAVTARIVPDAVLYITDSFEIKQGAVVGDKYLAVYRPAEAQVRVKLKPGAVVEGAGASSAEVIMDETRVLIATARAAVESVRSVIGSEETQQDLRQTVANLNQATARAVIITEQVVELVAGVSRTGQVSGRRAEEMMDHLVSASENVETMAARVDRLLEVSPVPAQLAMSGENIRKATEDIAALVAETRQKLDDTGAQQQLTDTIANLRAASENVRQATEQASELAGDEQIAADLRQTMTNVREASESLRSAADAAEGLITDEQTQANLRQSVENLRDASGAGAHAAERASTVMDDIENTLESVRRTQSVLREIQATPVMQVRGAPDDGLRADFYADVWPSPDSQDYLRVGLRDLGHTGRLQLLWSHPMGDDLLRAGVIGGKLGAAFEHSFGADRAVELELYNPDDLRLDLGTRWGLWRDYYLLLGVERVGGENDPFVGVRYQPGR